MKNKFNIYKVILIGIVILLLLFVYFNYTKKEKFYPVVLTYDKDYESRYNNKNQQSY